MPKKESAQSSFVVDEKRNLIFKSEQELFAHFKKQIETLEDDYESISAKGEFVVDAPEDYLESTLDDPDEIWFDKETFPNEEIYHFIKKNGGADSEGGLVADTEEAFYYIATCYMDTFDTPTFVFLHFATKQKDIVDNYRRGELIFDLSLKDLLMASIEGDALAEADPLAHGLFDAMMKVRNEKDIILDDFLDYQDLREETIEDADEIWRSPDSNGNVLVSFIKEFPDHAAGDIYYIAITQEDTSNQVHALLFSFPTKDESLVDRYRHGENLHAEEVTQESSH